MLQALLSEFLITKINKLTQTLGPENKNSEHHSITLDPKRNKSSLRRVFWLDFLWYLCSSWPSVRAHVASKRVKFCVGKYLFTFSSRLRLMKSWAVYLNLRQFFVFSSHCAWLIVPTLKTRSRAATFFVSSSLLSPKQNIRISQPIMGPVDGKKLGRNNLLAN